MHCGWLSLLTEFMPKAGKSLLEAQPLIWVLVFALFSNWLQVLMGILFRCLNITVLISMLCFFGGAYNGS